MKRLLYSLLFAAAVSGVALAGGNDKDIEAIKMLIDKAYVDGILNLGEISDIKKGFHKDFGLLYVKEGELNRLTLDKWIEGVKKKKAENPNGPEEKSTIKYLNVDVIGNTGTAKFEIYRGSQIVYTDNFMLLKFPNGWKIVAKISHHHST
jgi:hypothetical protein